MEQELCMKQVIVCINKRINPGQPSCVAKGGGEVLANRLEQEIEARGWNIKVKRFFCLGRCSEGPVLKLSPSGQFICEVTADKLQDVLKEIETFSQS